MLLKDTSLSDFVTPHGAVLKALLTGSDLLFKNIVKIYLTQDLPPYLGQEHSSEQEASAVLGNTTSSGMNTQVC